MALMSSSVKRSSLTMATDRAQVKSFFDPCVNRVLELIDGQVSSVMERCGSKPKVRLAPKEELLDPIAKAETKMVLLVGGFGNNEYLYRKVDEYCSDRSIQICRPNNPYVATLPEAIASRES